jgi:hypothetical protein
LFASAVGASVLVQEGERSIEARCAHVSRHEAVKVGPHEPVGSHSELAQDGVGVWVAGAITEDVGH